MRGFVLHDTEHHHLWSLLLLRNPIEHLEPVLARHFNVQQHRVWKWKALAVRELSRACEIRDRFLAIFGPPHNLKAAAVVQGTRQNEGVILRVLYHHDLSHAVRHTSHHHNPLRYL